MSVTIAHIDREVSSDGDVETLLNEFGGSKVSMITLQRARRRLTLGGGPERFMVAWDQGGEPPYFTLLTNAPLDGAVYLTTGGQLADYPVEFLVGLGRTLKRRSDSLSLLWEGEGWGEGGAPAHAE